MVRLLKSFDGTESVYAEYVRPDRYRHLFRALSEGTPAIARGAGLSYCAASAGPGVRTVSSLLFDRMLEFDGDRGTVRVEAGVHLGDLHSFVLRQGWILPVMPGHPSITVGGCIGCNVHGKNQYREGNFASVVEELTLFHPDHGEVRCSPRKESDLFELTVGGFGLTGFIISAQLRLERFDGSGIVVERMPVESLGEAVKVMRAHAETAHSLYSWHDLNGPTFGLGIVYVGYPGGEPVASDLRYRDLSAERRGRMWMGGVMRVGAGWGTRVYGWRERRTRRRTVLDVTSATFPVTGNEFYFELFGRRGFREYQVLVPWERWGETEERVTAAIRREGVPITLASLKAFRGGSKLLNFDGDGVCLTLDAAEGERTRRLFRALDNVTLVVGGRLNVAKDSRVDADLVSRVFPEYDRFRSRLTAFDPRRRFDSTLRGRLGV